MSSLRKWFSFRLDDDEKQTVNRGTFDPLVSTEGLEEGRVALTFVNELGLYRLIFSSRKREAERFQNWVFTEVLHAIRKTGRYDMVETEIRFNGG